MAEESLEPLLRNAIEALSDPTRGAILLELGRVGESTATQLARQLGLTANNVYHHMRVLTKLGLLEPPRVVPGKTYVEKYYRLKRALVMGARGPGWLDRAQRTLTLAERKALIISVCLRTAQMLRRAARRYEEMDAAALDDLFNRQQLGIFSINQMQRERFVYRLAGLRELIAREAELFPEGGGELEATDVVLMAGLPFFWETVLQN